MASFLLAGCNMSVPGLGSGDGPAVTGSIAPPVEIRQPLPQTLAYSDAARIGQAADAALWQAGPDSSGDWINRATGSSGSVHGAASVEDNATDGCRQFSTIVTSIGGVHSYSGRICKDGDGRAVVQIASPETAAPL